MKYKTKFWYESNACWGWVETLKDLQEKCKLQIDFMYGALRDVNEFLDRSMQHYDGSLNFGTRMEHTGVKSLREYLTETGELDKFIEAAKDQTLKETK